MKMPPTVANKQSDLLNTDENLQVFKLLGHRCETMATTVIQLFVTEPPSHSEWKLQKTGVLCFVKDNNHKSYFFRVYCLRTNQLVWQHEMYNNMDYQELMPYLHSFEGDQCIIGFHFANNNEAYQFYQVVKTKIDMRKRREERKSRALSQSSYQTVPTVNNNNNNLAPQKMPGFQIDSAMFKKTPNVEARLTKRKRGLTKAEIGLPTGFQHVSHVGWNADTGFDVSTEDENLKHFFKKAGVSQDELNDPVVKEFIYGFVEKNKETILNHPPNGVSRAGSNNSVAPPPAVPPRGPQNHKSVNRVAPPPPPATGPRLEKATSRPHQEAPRKPRPPSPPKYGPPGSGAVASLSGGGAPAPPPPPPPPPMDFCPPPPPPMGGNAGPQAVPGLGVMDPSSLRPTPPSNHAPVDNSRSNLLQEIQKGICLKPVDQRELRPPSSPSPGKEASNNSNDLADVLRDRLKDFLEKRSQAMNLSDTSDTDSNDEEWD